jgi:hypothetical protein
MTKEKTLSLELNAQELADILVCMYIALYEYKLANIETFKRIKNLYYKLQISK